VLISDPVATELFLRHTVQAFLWDNNKLPVQNLVVPVVVYVLTDIETSQMTCVLLSFEINNKHTCDTHFQSILDNLYIFFRPFSFLIVLLIQHLSNDISIHPKWVLAHPSDGWTGL